MTQFDIAYNTYADRIARGCSEGWIRKAYNECKKLWDATAVWAKIYVFDPTARLVDRIKRKLVKPRTGCPKIEWLAPMIRGSVHYIVEFYRQDNSLLYSKSGKADDVVNRIRHELSTEYAKDGAHHAKVLRVDYCGDNQTSANLEMQYRAHLLNLHGQDKWLQNDRWYTTFDLADYDKFVKNFFKKA